MDGRKLLVNEWICFLDSTLSPSGNTAEAIASIIEIELNAADANKCYVQEKEIILPGQ
jgi:hypothetical protein